MPIQLNIKSVPLSAIKVADTHFRISDSRALTPLVDSIQAVGLLVPPLVVPIDGGHYRIVSGFARIAVCQELAIESLSVRIAAADTPVSELIWATISENALARELTVMEKARAVTLLQKGYPDATDLTSVVQSLGVVESPKVVTKLSRLANLPASIQQAVEKGVVGLAMALTLGRLEHSDARQLIKLYQTLGLGLNRQREVLTLIEEIAKRESLSIDAVLATGVVVTLVNDIDRERVQRRGAFLNYLKRRRYPALTQREESFNQVKRELKLGPKVQFHPPPYFEGTTYRLLFEFDSMDELVQHHQKLYEISADSVLRELLR